MRGMAVSDGRYLQLFEDSPVSLWDEDFTEVGRCFTRLREAGVDDFRSFFGEHPEVLQELQRSVVILDVNRATLDLHGASSKEELLAGLDRIFVDESLVTFEAEMVALAEGATRFESDAVIKTLAGERRNMHMCLTVAPGAEADLSRVPVSCQDISKRKRNEEQRLFLEVRQHYEQSAKSMSVLAGGIAHDLNHLLVSILGNVSMASEDLPKNSPVQQFLSEVRGSAKRAGRLADEMLAISGTGSFVAKPFSFNERVRQIADLLRKTTADVDLSFDLAVEPITVTGDPTQIGQVVLNLLTNAVEAQCTKQQSIEVSTRIQDVDACSLPAACRAAHLGAGPFVLLVVKDQGAGMDAETCQRVFDPFFSTKGPGRGLGLASVAGIVHAHGGTVWVSSQLDEGTQVSVLLPLGDETLDPPTAEDPPWKGTVLIVDDEATVRSITQLSLERAGYRVHNACDGQEAIEVFSQDPARFDVVLLDAVMPGMDGRQVFAELRRIRPDIQIVLSSGCLEEEVVGASGLPGLAGFLPKP